MRDEGEGDRAVLDLLRHVGLQYEVYVDLARLASVVDTSRAAREGELVIDTARHPAGLVLWTDS